MLARFQKSLRRAQSVIGECLDSSNLVQLRPEILAVLPHDESASTQGLTFHNGCLFESTGLYGCSTVRHLDRTDGRILQLVPLPPQFYGEGLAGMEQNIVQITWREQQAFVFELPDLRCVDVRHYSGVGWGLAPIDSGFAMTNGSASLILYSHDFVARDERKIRLGQAGLTGLNDLEVVGPVVLFNVYGDRRLFAASFNAGNVIGVMDCSELFAIARPHRKMHILNGIANVRGTDLYYLTGKCWKHLFLVRLDLAAVRCDRAFNEMVAHG